MFGDPLRPVVVDADSYVGFAFRSTVTGVVDEHIQTSMLLSEMLSEMAAAVFISDVQLVETNIGFVFLTKFFDQLLQSFLAKRRISSCKWRIWRCVRPRNRQYLPVR